MLACARAKFSLLERRMKKIHFLMRVVVFLFSLLLSFSGFADLAHSAIGEQPLSKIAIDKATLALRDSAFIKASPLVLGLNVWSHFVVYYVLCFLYFHLLSALKFFFLLL